MSAVARILRGLGIVRQARHPDAEAIERLGVFDREAYLRRYPDVAASGVDPLLHFVTTGAREGRWPCAYFDPAYYLENNPDVVAAGANPLLHFCRTGWQESRHPSADFDLVWYADAHLGADAGKTNPLLHYLRFGREQGLEVRPVLDPDEEAIRASGVFDEAYYLSAHPDVAESGVNPLRHYLRSGAREGRDPSPLFDTAYYLGNNRDVAESGINPLLHFCLRGWKELRNPSRGFDVWWYWSRYLDPAVEGANPLGHYQAIGCAAGFEPRPPARPAPSIGNAHRHSPGKPIRRLCLFAGYDRDGVVDKYVVDYVRELARHADVYYLADCEMADGELHKLAGHAKGAWAGRHGKYDFGSWSELVARLGWDFVEAYDEVLLVNDSCYLLRDLDEVFARMDGRACDWWGLQATKGIAATKDSPSNRFARPVPMHEVRASLLERFERDHCYDFLLGSYFLAFRGPVLREPHFRRLMESVTQQDSKQNLVLKYEVGVTRHLIALGYEFDTFVGALYPFHPIFSNWYFRLLDEGFPLFKRYLLSENHYEVPGLHRWADRIRQSVPGADIDTIEANLARVVDPARLHANLHLGEDRPVRDDPPPERLLTDEEFMLADRASPKHGNWWAFPACAFTGTFSGNERAVFEEVRRDPGIRKIILTRGKPVEAVGENVEVVELETPVGQHRLMRAGNIFVKHSVGRNVVFPVSAGLHNIINLWHGIPFKRIGYVSADMHGRLDHVAAENMKYRAVISSSRVDALAMASAFYPVSPHDVWNTGLPRNDFILREESRLPGDMQARIAELGRRLEGRRLVLFMPTFRNEQEAAAYWFSEEEKAALFAWLRREGAVLGLREHMADSGGAYGLQLSGPDVIDLSADAYPDAEILYRVSSALVTDYSSCFIDYMLTGKPAVSFAYDYDRYVGMERGAFYDLEDVFPGEVCRNFGEFMAALEGLFSQVDAPRRARIESTRKLFFDRIDDCNSARVVARVRELVDCQGIGTNQLELH